jgi:preprotein translocase subunit SecE
MTRKKSTSTPAEAGASAGTPKKKRVGPFQYLAQVRQEGRKVTWTSRQETIVSTIMVVIMSIFAMIFFFGVDSLIGFIVRRILGLGAGA